MLNFYVGPRNQKGRGIGSLFSGLLRTLSPIAKPIANFAKNAFKNFAKSDLAKNLANTALSTGKEFAKNMAADLIEGKDLKETARNQLEEAKIGLHKPLEVVVEEREREINLFKKQVVNQKMFAKN